MTDWITHYSLADADMHRDEGMKKKGKVEEKGRL